MIRFLFLGLMAVFCSGVYPHDLTMEKFLHDNNIKVGMGHILKKDSAQAEEILKFVKSHPEVKKICEIGFNAGHSSELFLTARGDITVLSFDLGKFYYVKKCKQWIDQNYPNRHKLVLGDSRLTLPKYISNHPSQKFDLIFIDGGHTYDVAKSDILNSLKLANNETFIIIDDLKYASVLSAWEEAIRNNLIFEVERKKLSNKCWGIGKILTRCIVPNCDGEVGL